MKPQPKPHTPRDKFFLKWLLTRPCELKHRGWCQGDMIYHHTSGGGMSNKGSDYEAISVCFRHHTDFDNATKRGIGIFAEGELAAIIERNKAAYLATGREIK